MPGPCGRPLPFAGKAPRLGRDVFIDPGARVIGDVSLGDGVAVLFAAVVRGTDDSVSIGSGTAILEHALVEAPEGHPVRIGERVLISHGAIVHGAVVGDGSLIGIGARVLDGAVVGPGSIVAAGAVVPPGKTVPPGMIVAGVPARPLRSATSSDLERVARELSLVHSKVPGYREALGCD